jgi:predicted HAD superfamily Cof-like phosphohydrolase
MMSEFKDVSKFHRKFGQLSSRRIRHLTKRKLAERIKFMLEELIEFADGAGIVVYVDPVKREFTTHATDHPQCLACQADALIDLVYVAKGTADMMGLPWKELWDDVQRANMAKVRGTTHRGNKVDVTKPEGWVGPQTEAILKANGYIAALDNQENNYVDDPEHL